MVFSYKNSKNNSFDLKKQYTTNPVKKDKKFFMAQGDSFMLKNEYRKAIKEYLLSLMLDKSDIRAYKSTSKAYKNLHEYDKAIKHLKNARNVYGFDSEIYYELGLNYLLNSDNENAQRNFIRTIKLSPDNKNAQIKLALTHELSGENDMAEMIYKAIVEKYPYYIPALSNLASLYIDTNKFSEAILLFKQMLKINPDFYRAYLGIGLCFDKLEKYTFAIRYYKKYISAKPNSPTSKSLVGRICEIHSKREKNLKSLKGSNVIKLVDKK